MNHEAVLIIHDFTWRKKREKEICFEENSKEKDKSDRIVQVCLIFVIFIPSILFCQIVLSYMWTGAKTASCGVSGRN